jgi:hypothetical protein
MKLGKASKRKYGRFRGPKTGSITNKGLYFLE